MCHPACQNDAALTVVGWAQGSAARLVSISHCGDVVIFSHEGGGSLEVVTINGLAVASKPQSDCINCMAISRDSDWLITGSAHGTLSVSGYCARVLVLAHLIAAGCVRC